MDNGGYPGDRLFTSDFIFATLANFANAFGMQMLVATLPVYVIGLGGSAADAGLVTGALAFTSLLFRPFVGWLTDAWRRRPLVLIGTACYGIASGIYLWPPRSRFWCWAGSYTDSGCAVTPQHRTPISPILRRSRGGRNPWGFSPLHRLWVSSSGPLSVSC